MFFNLVYMRPGGYVQYLEITEESNTCYINALSDPLFYRFNELHSQMNNLYSALMLFNVACKFNFRLSF